MRSRSSASARATRLLDVDNPGSVPAESLSDPALAPALAAAALQTLQCGVENYAATAGMLSGEYLNANGFVDNHVWEWRSVTDIKAAPGSCNYGRGTTAMGFYTPLQQARFQLDDAFNRLDKFTDAQVSGRASIDGADARVCRLCRPAARRRDVRDDDGQRSEDDACGRVCGRRGALLRRHHARDGGQ